MPLNPPVKSGLRRIHNGSKQPAKVAVVVLPGDELEVSDDVASQLQSASSAFKDGPAPEPVAAPESDAEVEEVAAPVEKKAVRARKRSAS